MERRVAFVVALLLAIAGMQTRALGQSWPQTYHSGGLYTGTGIAIASGDTSHYVYVCGYKYIPAASPTYAGFVAKYSTSGSLQWEEQVPSDLTPPQYPYGIGFNAIAAYQADSTHTYIYATGITTASFSGGAYNTTTLTVCFDQNGAQEWKAESAMNGATGTPTTGRYATAIALDQAGDPVVAGQAGGNLVVQWFPGGSSGGDTSTSWEEDVQIQVPTTTDPCVPSAYGVVVDSNDSIRAVAEEYSVADDYTGIAITCQQTGSYSGGGGSAVDSPLVYPNSDTGTAGIAHSDQTYPQSGYPHYYPPSDAQYRDAIAADGSGNVYVAGWQPGTSNDDALTLQATSTNGLGYAATYNGGASSSRPTHGEAITVDSGTGDVFMAVKVQETSGTAIRAVQMTSSGESWASNEWTDSGSTDSEPADIAVYDGDPVVTGYEKDSSGAHEYATLKYEPGSSNDPIWSKVELDSNVSASSQQAAAVLIDVDGSSTYVYVTGTIFTTLDSYDSSIRDSQAGTYRYTW